jgi:hypothetical protein
MKKMMLMIQQIPMAQHQVNNLDKVNSNLINL